MKNYAFIFARGGSKGLPRKNIRPLAGKPLIQYSIEAAQRSADIDSLYVSTEDLEIADLALSLGAKLIERPPELAEDHSPEWLSWQHAIGYVEQSEGSFDTFVCLPATSPLRAQSDISSALEKLNADTENDICISVTPANRSPFFNMVQGRVDGTVELVCKPDKSVSRRQDAPVIFDITTVVYAAKPSFILKETSMFSGRVVSIEVPKNRSIDIDDIEDFLFAESIIKGKSNAVE